MAINYECFILLIVMLYFCKKETTRADFFLSVNEENELLRQYENYLNDFCRRFEPHMPKFVVGTACHYFKRFYLYNSAMDYHPKEILFVFCLNLDY